MAIVRSTRTGKIVSVPDHYVGHPVLGNNLVLVEDEIKAAPKKENKKSLWQKSETLETQEQPAPEVNINEDKDIEDAH